MKRPELRKEYVGGVVLVALFLFLAAKDLSTYPLKSSEVNKEYVVELKEDGFVPQELAVGAHDTVTWKTTRKSFFWPASDPHPTHTTYSGFDPEEPVPPGGSWSFRFDKEGVWKYHDHLSPYYRGVITVKGKSTAALPCASDSKTSECWQELLTNTLKDEGLAPTLDLVAKLYADEPEFPSACHGYTHNIGLVSYQLYLKDKDSVLSPKSAFCANGFYHGFMEGFFAADPDPLRAREFCDYVDAKLKEESPDASLQCHHGIGHGAVELTLRLNRTNVDERRITSAALTLCEESSKTEEQLYRCASGVFNGIANFYISGEGDLEVNTENPIWLCDEQPDRYKESCYGNMNATIFWFAKNDMDDAVKIVERIQDETYAVPAMRYLTGLAALYVKNKLPEAVRVCRTLSPSFHTPCIEGLAHGFLEHGSPGLEYEDALRFCRTEGMSAEEQDLCFQYTLTNLHGWYSKAKTETICNTVEEKYRHFCRPASS